MKKKLLLCATLSLLLATAALFLLPIGNRLLSEAQEDTFSLALSKKQVRKDQTVTVKIVIHSAESMQSVQAALSYDPTVLEYVEDTQQTAVTGTSGALTLNDTYAVATTDKTYRLKFRALQLGECELSLFDACYTRYDDLSLVKKGASHAQLECIVNDGVQDDCTLSELFTAVGEWQEEWDPDTYEYHITVPSDTTIFAYSATPACDDAEVVSDGPESLSDGCNTYRITVTAPSGDSAAYTLYVTR